MNSTYSERHIVYLDILGFKELVRNSKIPDKIREILDTLHSFGGSKGEIVSKLEKKYKNTLEIAFFSDSLVLSCEQLYASYMLEDVVDLQLDLMKNGVFIRGCVSKGNLYHKGNYIYGPALIDAYEGESQMAKYPRVILDQSYDYGGTMFCKDYDGISFLDPFRRLQEKAQDEGLPLDKTIREIISYVEKNIDDNDRLGIKSKYIWLMQLINEIFYVENGEYKYFWPSYSTYDRNETYQKLRDFYLKRENKTAVESIR